MADFIPEPVIKRLPVYYRNLQELRQKGVGQISSQSLAEIMNLTASQIRQDINRIGATGRQGYGYCVSELEAYIAALMGINKPHRVIIIGAGNIGHALALSPSFAAEGFEVAAIFDCDKRKIGENIGDLRVRDIKSIQSYLEAEAKDTTKELIDIAVLALPAGVTHDIAEKLLKIGILGFWNFAPVDLNLGSRAAVVNVHLTDGLEVLSYQLKHLGS